MNLETNLSSFKYVCNLGNSLFNFVYFLLLKNKSYRNKGVEKEAKKAFKMHFKDRQECEME